MDDEYTFKGQREGEKVVSVKNGHALTLLPKLLVSILVWLVGVVIILFWSGLVAWILFVLLLLVGIYLQIRAMYGYNNTVLVVTNERIINVIQSGFFDSSVVEAEIGDVHNMTSHKGGLFRSIFNYGDLTIRISDAVSDREIVVKNIFKPYDTEALISSVKSDSRELEAPKRPMVDSVKK